MRYIEATGIKFAHIATPDELKALCGMKAFPWDWHQPVERKKAVCVACLTALRKR